MSGKLVSAMRRTITKHILSTTGEPSNSAEKVIELSQPSTDALRQAESAAKRIRKRAAPVRRAFIKGVKDRAAPLWQIMQGGGSVRLKLYLSLLWVAGGEPFKTDFPAYRWAALLALPHTEATGARRVNDALSQLAKLRLLRLERQPGMPTVTFVLDDGGQGVEYKHPAKVNQAYVRLPSTFWTNGWLAGMSGIAIAIFLVLRDCQDYKSPNKPVWVTPALARDRYGFSADSWTRGVAELKRLGLIQVRRKSVNPNDFDFTRVRNTYIVNQERITSTTYGDARAEAEDLAKDDDEEKLGSKHEGRGQQK